MRYGRAVSLVPCTHKAHTQLTSLSPGTTARGGTARSGSARVHPPLGLSTAGGTTAHRSAALTFIRTELDRNAPSKARLRRAGWSAWASCGRSCLSSFPVACAFFRMGITHQKVAREMTPAWSSGARAVVASEFCSCRTQTRASTDRENTLRRSTR